MQAPIAQEPQKKKKRGFLKWGVGVVAVVGLFSIVTNNNDDDGTTTAESANSVDLVAEAEAEAPAAEAEAPAAEAAPADDGVSTEFSNALRSAERILVFSYYSYKCLLDLLNSVYVDTY